MNIYLKNNRWYNLLKNINKFLEINIINYMKILLFWLLVSLFLSLKWITNKKLHLKNIDNKLIVLSRYFISLIMVIFYIFLINISFPKEVIFNKINLLIILFVMLDFIWTILNQYNFKRNWHSTFLNISSVIKSVLYIPVAILFLNETINFYQSIWIFIIILWIILYQRYITNWKKKEYNFKDWYIWINIIIWILNVFIISLYMKGWWNYLFWLLNIYIWVIFLYLSSYWYDYFKQKEIINFKFDKLLILDWILFWLWSIWTLYLYKITESYQVSLLLTATYMINVILFKIFYKEKHFFIKLMLSSIIIIWIIILKLCH